MSLESELECGCRIRPIQVGAVDRLTFALDTPKRVGTFGRMPHLAEDQMKYRAERVEDNWLSAGKKYE